MQELVELEEEILQYKGRELPDDLLRRAKQDGFADRYLAKLLDAPEDKIRQQRYQMGTAPGLGGGAGERGGERRVLLFHL
jgi:carbamoyl-phosphate synthase large subunit